MGDALAAGDDPFTLGVTEAVAAILGRWCFFRPRSKPERQAREKQRKSVAKEARITNGWIQSATSVAEWLLGSGVHQSRIGLLSDRLALGLSTSSTENHECHAASTAVDVRCILFS